MILVLYQTCAYQRIENAKWELCRYLLKGLKLFPRTTMAELRPKIHKRRLENMTITLLFETFSSYTTPSSALYSLQPSFSIHAAVKFYQAFYEPNFFIGVQYLSQQMLRSSCSLFSSPVSLYSFHFIEKGFSFHETRLVLLSIRPPF